MFKGQRQLNIGSLWTTSEQPVRLELGIHTAHATNAAHRSPSFPPFPLPLVRGLGSASLGWAGRPSLSHLGRVWPRDALGQQHAGGRVGAPTVSRGRRRVSTHAPARAIHHEAVSQAPAGPRTREACGTT